jgi:hypothetical protein
MQKLIAAGLTLMMAAPASAQVREAAAKAATAAAAQTTQQLSQAGNSNPYFLPSVLLMAGGGLVMLVGATHDTGASCTDTLSTFECHTTKSIGTVIAGAGIVGVGFYLFHKGASPSHASSPIVTVGSGVVAIRQRVSW